MQAMNSRGAMTDQEKCKTLLNRVGRLQVFAGRFGGRWNHMMEVGAYGVLETYQSRERAIARYLRYALTMYFFGLRFHFHWTRRYWWQRLLGRGHDRAVERVIAALEKQWDKDLGKLEDSCK